MARPPHELKKASVCLKPGKSVAADNLCNEMILCLLEVSPGLLLKLFNLILDTGCVLPDWVMSYIVPIHKDGSKSDPSNYRGISLLSCLGKFFLSIVHNRLAKFTSDNNILSASQLGFQKGNRTSDAHIIIRNIIDKYCHKNSKRIYSCFIDLSKAFDTVPRDILLNKLQNFGIKGKLFNIIRGIYSNDFACVKIGNTRSESFAINQGVRQGCVLSPLLFNIFLADLAKELSSLNDKLRMGNEGINSIFWADDIVLLGQTEENLKEMLNIVNTYCCAYKLTINCKKTKCLIFNKTGRLFRTKFYLNGTDLENVREYKYLGFIFTPSGEIRTGLEDLRDRALKAFYSLKNKMGTAFYRNIPTSLSLFDSLIKPILLYASDFWGPLKLPANNPIENLQMRVFKELLGVSKKTTNIGVLLELGRTSLDIIAIKLGVKNWERVRKGHANPILVASYRDAVARKLPWIQGIEGYLQRNGLLSLFLNEYPEVPNFIHKKLYGIMVDQFHQNAFATIRTPQSKLRTYALIKTEIGMEKYLVEAQNVQMRVKYTKFRLSSHNLMIETGRYKKMKPEERVCPFCPREIEDEMHFLLDCYIYSAIRDPIMVNVVEENYFFQFFRRELKFQYLLNRYPHEVSNFILKSFELRDFLLQCPKRSV